MDGEDSITSDFHSESVIHTEKLLTQSQKAESKHSTFRNWSIDFGHSRNNSVKDPQIKGTGYQFMALIKKSIALQAKQKGTNICQILTPIICLLFVWLIKSIMSKPFTERYSYTLPFPYIYNVPYDTVYGKGNTFADGQVSPINITDCLQWYLYDFEGADDFTKNFVGNANSGMMSRMFPPMMGSEFMYNCGTQGPMPYFQTPENETIDEDIYNNLQIVNSLPLLKGGEVSNLSLVPDGAVTFYEASEDSLSVKLQINDISYFALHRTNGVTRYKINMPDGEHQSISTVNDGQLILLDLITQSYSQSLFDDVYMISGSLPMPVTTTKDIMMEKFYNGVGSTLYPIALSLMLPVFLYVLVLEKEERLREIMKMSGLKISNYWIANYAWSLCLYCVSAFLFYLVGRYLVVLDYFRSTDPLVVFVTFFGWGLSQVSLSFFYQNFISKAKTAIISGYLLSLCTAVIGSTLGFAIYASPKPMPLMFLIYPPIAFTRIIYLQCLKCGDQACLSDLSELSPEMAECLKIMYLGALVFFIVGLYLDEVMPKEYGVRKHPLFFIKALFSANSSKKNSAVKEASSVESKTDDEEQEKNEAEEDEGLKEEVAFVSKLQPPFDRIPLVIKNLRKVYKPVGGKPAKIAVKDFSLHIKKGETFGLLGPNGAGKTSLISMLTGLYAPEGGNAWIGGYDILSDIDQVHTQIGVCPQFDLLWADLTVEEHLYFYARIRGISGRDEKAVVEKAMKEVYLTKFASFQTKRLSGGMKRRLSVAISLVGDPKVIYLDEPTTGLDPENRRQLWNILAEAKGDRAIILTTHSMEEADVLCTRIGIMTNGAMQCIGSQTRLKRKYGGGYHLFINCHKNKQVSQQVDQSQEKGSEEEFQQVQQYIKKLYPQSELKSSFNGNFVFLIPTKDLEVSRVFGHLESKKTELGISDWGISQSTLEDVFMEIV